jgi:hypothetical protein
MIPKLIIQTGPPKIPLLLKSAITTVRLLHPDYEYRFFDDAMIGVFLDEHFPEYKADYESFPFRIQRYDFFRYLAVYRFGGFYLDLDIFLAERLDALLSSECVFPFEELAESPYFWEELGMDWQIGNYAFAAEPRHPFLAKVIENCLRAKHDGAWTRPMMKGIPRPIQKDFAVLNSTGPGMLSRTYAEHQELVGGINVLFPEDVCDQDSWHQFGRFGVHHMAGSWRPNTSFWERRWIRLWETWTSRRILAEGRTRGRSRDRRLIGPGQAR